MSRKIRLTAASSFVLLAMAILPAVASAGEFTADCTTGPGGTCTGTVAGGPLEIRTTNEETIVCNEITGAVTQTWGSSTGTIELEIFGCRETVTAFKGKCGTIKTGKLVTHIVNVAEAPNVETGLLITGINVKPFCGWWFEDLTGNLIGLFESPECGTYRTSHKIVFTSSSSGHQKPNQVTETGPILDLSVNQFLGGNNVTAAIVATTTISWNVNSLVNITC